MKPYQKRLLEDYRRVRKEELKLFNYILIRELGLSETKPKAPMDLLKMQYEAMHEYSKVLAIRIVTELDKEEIDKYI